MDNIDYAASILDMQRSHGRSRLSNSAGGGSTLNNRGRDRITYTSGGGDGKVRGPQRSSKATRLSGPRRGGQEAFGRMGISLSAQDLRKMMDLHNAGRRR